MPVTPDVLKFTRDTGNTTTVTANVLVAVPAGAKFVVVANAPVTGSITAWSISDSKGNTYSPARVTQNGTSLNYQMAMFDSVVSTALTTSDTVTISVTGASPAKWDVYGLYSNDAGAFDSSGTSVGSASAVSVATASGAQSSQLAVVAVAFTDTGATTTITPDAGFTAGTKLTASPSSAPRSLQVFWQYANSAGAKSFAGTLSSSQGWGATIVTYNTAVAKKTHYFNGTIWIDLKDAVIIDGITDPTTYGLGTYGTGTYGR